MMAASNSIAAMRTVEAIFTWFICATYQGLLHTRNTGFMRDMFYPITYEMLNNVLVKNSDTFVKESFVMPGVHHKIHTCASIRVLNVLKKHISAKVQMMISAGDIQSAIAQLGGTIVQVGNGAENNLIEIVSKRYKHTLLQLRERVANWKEKMFLPRSR